MSNLHLYSNELCPFAHRVRLALAEKNLAADVVEIDLKNKPASFLSISPTGQVPVLVHGDVKLRESAVITEYLDEVFPNPPLMPLRPADRALARIWVRFVDERLYGDTHSLIFARTEEERRRLATRMSETVRVLDAELLAKHGAVGPYAFGKRFTLVDVTLHPWFEQLDALEQLSEFRRPQVSGRTAEWRRAMSERKAVQSCSRASNWYVERYRAHFAA